MDKKIIKNILKMSFINEDSTPGIDVTEKARKESDKINKAAIKDMAKDSLAYDKDIKNTDNKKAGKMATNKFNYNTDKEKAYHVDMEIMNGQEMIQYDREPNQEFKDRAKEAIVGSSRMGNEGGIGNAEPVWGASSADFGKNLVKTAAASFKKRMDAENGILSFGDVIMPTPKGSKPRGKHTALKEDTTGGSDYEAREYAFKSDPKNREEMSKMNDKTKSKTKPKEVSENKDLKASKNTEQDNPYGTDSEYDFKNSEEARNPDYKTKKENNNKKPIKESMKRLRFKKEFNGVGNALKMIPETYRINNKTFEMTDGNESYRIRWEGTLSEGRAVILTAANKEMVNEDMQHMKHLMGYKPQNTLGLVKGLSRINENAIFKNIYDKSKTLLEGEDIEDEDASTSDLDSVVSHAKEAKKHVEGSVSKDKGTQAKKPKNGEWENIKNKAPEATKHVDGSVKGKVGMGLGVKAKQGEWDQINMPQAAKHGSESSATYAPAAKTGEWDKISVPHATDAKKHISMSEGLKKKSLIVGNKVFLPMNENYMDEGWGDDKQTRGLSPEEAEAKRRELGAPTYSENYMEEEYLDEGRGVSDDLAREFFELRFRRDPEQDYNYFETWKERLNSHDPEAQMDNASIRVWNEVKNRRGHGDGISSLPGI